MTRFFSSLRFRLMLLVFLALLPAFGFIVHTAREERRHRAEDVKLEALRLTQLTGSHIEDFIEGGRQLLMALSISQIVQNQNAAECNKHFAAILKRSPQYVNIAAADKAANLYASAIPSSRPINFKDRMWFQKVLHTRDFIVGEFLIARITGKPALTLAYPVLNRKGVFWGAIYVGLDMTWLNQMVKEAKLPEGTELTVVDHQGTLLAHYPDTPEQWVGKVMPEAAIVKTTLALKEGVTEVKGLDGIQRLYAFVPIHSAVDTGLYVITGIPKEIAFAEINRQLYRNLAVLGLVAALALAGAWIFADLLVLRRLNSLVEATRRLRGGDLRTRTGLPYGQGELSQLALTFDEMAASLEQREDERRQAEAELRRRNRHLSVLYTIDRAASQSLELESILNDAVEATLEALEIEAAGVFLLENDGKTMTFRVHRGLSDEFVTNVKYIQLGEGISGRAAAERKPVVLDVGDYPSERLAPYIIKEGFQTLASTPLISAGQLLGALNLATHRQRAFPPEEMELLTSIGRQLGSAVRNAQLYESIQQELAERKQVEETLRESENRYKQLVETTTDYIYTVKIEDGRAVATTHGPGCIAVTGYTAEEYEADPSLWYRMVYEEDRPAVMEQTAKIKAGEWAPPLQHRIIHKDGSLRWVRNTPVRRLDEQKRLIAYDGLISDITERQQAEEELRKSEGKYRILIDNIQDGVFVIQDGKMQFVNEAFAGIGGYTVEEVVGMDFRQLVAPEDLEMVADRYRRRQAGEEVPKEYEFQVLHKDKTTRRTVNMNVGLINYRGRVASMGTVKDITEQKQLEAQLLQAQKMEAVGTLAGGVAHDFNNLLTAMMGNLELAKMKLERGQRAEEHLGEMENITQRAATLTNQLLAFSRRQIMQPVPLKLNDAITNMVRMLSRLLGEHIQLDLRLAADLGTIKADPGQIEQIIMNLCVNARDAMPTRGKLMLTTTNVRLEDNYINNHPWVEKGDYVVLEITDSGCGMDEAIRQRIFEPFFTTKEVGKGSGLGLSMVYGIVKQHQGYVNVYSEPGQGTTFKIYLPLLEGKVVVEKVKEAPQEVRGGQEAILLAEDEEQLREAIKNVLEMYGYNVLTASDGQEAVEIYEQEREKIELVILDAVMPKMGGMEAANYIYKLNPSQKVLFSSGYSADSLHESFTIPIEMHFIQKPYTAKALAQKVREVLEE